MTDKTRNARLQKLRELQALASSAMIGEQKRAENRARVSELQQQMKAIDEAVAAELRKHGIVVLSG